MKKKRPKTEEFIQTIRKADGGQTVEEVCREENICVQTFYRRRRKYGRMEMADAKRFKELVNDVWSWDFVHTRTENGVPLKTAHSHRRI
jgi:putative transposase